MAIENMYLFNLCLLGTVVLLGLLGLDKILFLTYCSSFK